MLQALIVIAVLCFIDSIIARRATARALKDRAEVLNTCLRYMEVTKEIKEIQADEVVRLTQKIIILEDELSTCKAALLFGLHTLKRE